MIHLLENHKLKLNQGETYDLSSPLTIDFVMDLVMKISRKRNPQVQTVLLKNSAK